MELLKSMARLHVVHVPYKGGAPAVADLIGGQTDVMFAAFPEAAPHVNGGRLRALAISSPTRSKLLPATPTVAEAGVKGFEAIGWQGLLAPGTTSPEIVKQIHQAVAAALALPENRARIDAMGIEFSGEGPEGFQRFMAREVPKWAKVVKASGAKID
jgi:tripartite-type tricarboxylate transporter receptor subunit TctC